jgi:hypothetical protein
MTNVGRAGGAPAGQGPAAIPVQDPFQNERSIVDRRLGRDVNFAGSEGMDLDEDALDASSTAAGREADFLKSMRTALRDSSRQCKDETSDSPGDPSTNLLLIAVAERNDQGGLPSPWNDAQASAALADAGIEASVASITARIEQAFREEMAPEPGQVFDLHIDLADSSLGISGLRVIVSGPAIEVILEHPEAAAEAQLAAAGQELASRLMTRLSKQSVRILCSVHRDGQAGARRDAAPNPSPFNLFPSP